MFERVVNSWKTTWEDSMWTTERCAVRLGRCIETRTFRQGVYSYS